MVSARFRRRFLMANVATTVPPRPIKTKLEETIRTLAQMQTAPTRSMVSERALAIEVNTYLLSLGTADFMLCAEVRVRWAFWSRYFPREVLKQRPDLQKYAVSIA